MYHAGTRGLVWTWRHACVQEAGNRGSGAAVLAAALGKTECCMRIKEADLEYVVRVYECGCKDLGEDGRLCTVLLGRVFSAVMAQDCAGVVDLSVAGV